jgi:tetratricopeptide (TPR) repeat protein
MAAKRKITFTITPSAKSSARANTISALRKAATLVERGELEPARHIADKIIQAQPQHFDTLHLLGIIAAREKRPAEAIELLGRALALKRDAAAYANRGTARNTLGHYAKALADCDQAIALDSGLVAAHHARGHALKGLRRVDEAFASFDRAVALDPEFAEAWHQRGNTCLRLKRLHNAIASYDRALELRPGNAATHSDRGVALRALRRHEDALASYDRALALQPGLASAHGNRGIALSELGRHHEAIASFERAIAIKPDYIEARANEGLCRLLTGDFARGWPAYEWRWRQRAVEFVPAPGSDKVLLTPENFGKPAWDGATTKAALLVWPEQGIGDQILFASMLSDVQQRAGKVILALEQRLHPLFARSFPECTVTTLEAARAADAFDCQIPLGSLGQYCRNSTDEFLRPRKAFLKADPVRRAALRKSISGPDRKICGISWHSRHAEHGADKSMTLAGLRPVFDIADFRFVDLQYGDTAAEREALLKDGGIELLHLDAIDNLQDLDGLAALIDACDVIVTISNTTAHIAGALGKEVWLMLPHSTGRFWYWQAGRDDTLWYPNVHVVRQDTAGDWHTVIERVRAALTTGAAPQSAARRKTPARKKQSAP